MKLRARDIAWLLPLLLCACVHNANQSQVQPLAPPIEDEPVLKPNKAPDKLPPPVITIPQETPIVVSQAEPPKPAPKHKKTAPKATTPAATAPAPAQTTQTASATPPPEVNAIGQLATRETSNSTKKASDDIADVEKGLSGISRKLSEQEEKTSTQIKEFLKQAKTALTTGDAEGAATLVAKAKVLLGELTQ
ncbi:MAG TPA: hypothetical protein VGG85_05570 [Terracidiphilus sp.]|jgi:outer membrane biosynthesis protein TonB